MFSDPTAHPTRAEFARGLLRYEMEEYSQDGFCADWLRSLEWDLREAAHKEPGELKDRLLKRIAPECLRLAEIRDGWWPWGDGASENPSFIPLAYWRERATIRPSRSPE